MNKVELAAAVAEKTGLTKKDAEKAVNAIVDSIACELAKGGKVQLVGFGSFETKERAAYTGHDPRTMKPIKIAATKIPSFKAGKALKDAVAK